MSRTGATDVVDLSGNGKGVALNVDTVGHFQQFPTSYRLTQIIDNGRVVFDTTSKKLYLGDGVTLGGKLVTSA